VSASRRAVAWGVAGVLGLALAAGLTAAAEQVTSQHVGLSAEPVSAGRALAPGDGRRQASGDDAPSRPSAHIRRPATRPAPAAGQPSPASPATSPPAATPPATESDGEAGDD
jgi:hypothetical protein